MGLLLSKRKMYDRLEGEYDSGAPLPKRLKPNDYCPDSHELAANAAQYNALDLYGLYPPLLRNLSSIEKSMMNGLSQLESILHYSFNNKLILLEACNHHTNPNHLCASNERLEHLGDVKLGGVLSDFSFGDLNMYSPGVMTEIKSKVLCNDALGVVLVRQGLHVFLKNKFNRKKKRDIENFVQNQIRNGHTFIDEQLAFEPTGNGIEQMSVRIEIPKELGDFFEALAGAVFVDSGCSYATMWDVFSPFLQCGLAKAKQNPRSVIQEVESLHPSAKFKDLGVFRNRASAGLVIGNVTFKGTGYNYQTAKKAAATYALKYLDPWFHTTVPAPLRGI